MNSASGTVPRTYNAGTYSDQAKHFDLADCSAYEMKIGSKSKLLKQFTQYVLVGGLAFAVDFLALYAFTAHAGLHYLVSATTGFLLGLVTNYVLCIWLVFDHRTLSNRMHEFIIFAAIGLVGLVLNNLIIFGLTEGVSFHYLHSKILAASIILVFNFSVRRALLFTERKAAS